MSNMSKWEQGVNEYVRELYEQLAEAEKFAGHKFNKQEVKKAILNGATDWREYSYSGCSLIYNIDIAERLATPSEIKSKTLKNGELNEYANSREQWLDVQARALFQAANIIIEEYYK